MNDTMNANVAYQESLRDEVTVVGFNRRLIAALYDAFLIAFLTFILIFALGFIAIFVDMFRATDTDRIQALMAISALLASLLYFVVSWARSGQTIGMAVTGMKVVRKDGSPLGYGKAILRYIGYVISAVVFALGFLWIGFDRNRQGWHDKIAGTVVTLSDDEFSGQPATFTPLDSGESKWVWVVVWFIFALLAPGVLIASALWLLGPFIGQAFGILGG